MSALKWRYKGEPATNYRGQSNIRNTLRPIFQRDVRECEISAKSNITGRFWDFVYFGEAGRSLNHTILLGD